MNHMTEYAQELEWQRGDEEERQQRVIEALQVAESYGVPRERIEILAIEAGVSYPREKT